MQPFAALVYAFAPAAMRAPWSLIDAEPPKRALERAAAACAALGVPLLISVDDMLQVGAALRERACVRALSDALARTLCSVVTGARWAAEWMDAQTSRACACERTATRAIVGQSAAVHRSIGEVGR